MSRILSLLRLFGLLCVVSTVTVVPTVYAAGGEVALEHLPDRQGNMPALQNGAKLFVNYCLGCHSLHLVRYSELGRLGLTESQIKDNLLFGGGRVGDLMTVAMQPLDAKEWFGVTPPDLSLEARARTSELGSGGDWIYTYLKSFYLDPTRPSGWNNRIFPNAAMPHVLWSFQGSQKLVGEGANQHLALASPGSMSHEEYNDAVADISNFLVWAAEPIKQTRQQIGFFVLLALFILTILAWLLSRSYWREVR